MEVEWGTIFKCPAARWKNWPSLHAHEKSGSTRKAAPLSPGQIEKRIRYVNENYEVIDWDQARGKAQVTCKNKDSHTTDTGDGQTIIFIGSDEMGAVSYHCSHAHCADFNKEETSRLWEGFMGNEAFILPSGTQKLNEMVTRLFDQLNLNQTHYRRSENAPYTISYWRPGRAEVLNLTRGSLGNLMGEEKINFLKYNTKGKLVPTQPLKEYASAILEAHQARVLPIVEAILEHPLLVKTPEGAELVGEKYCPELKTIVLGTTREFPEMDFEKGLFLLNQLMDYWIWKEPGDRARGLAELITPALFHGGFIQRPIPAFLIMGDDYDAGKTAWQEDVAQIYGHCLDAHNHSKLSISSMDEKLERARYQGDPFFFIDELDGVIKNTSINAYITGGDEASVRIAYRPFAKVSAKLIILLAGVKNFSIDEQLSSRTMIIRIIKPMTDANWYTPDGVYLKTWVKDHAKEYLAAIYALITEWVKRGSVPDKEVKCRFPEWEKQVNGILKMVGLPGATEGLALIQNELSNPAQNWLPLFSKCLEEAGVLYSGAGEGKLLSLAILRSICDTSGLEIPGVNPLLRDGILHAIKARRIGEIIVSLPRANETNGREPIYRLGDFYLVQYLLPEGNKRKKSYLFSTSTQLPQETCKHTPETVPEM